MNAPNSSNHSVRIHIDRQAHESPNPTTAEALYALGNVAEHEHLFSEASGDSEDEPVRRDSSVVHLIQDQHFYSQREFKIVVNARPKETPKHELSFGEVVHLAFDNPPTGPNILFTITYRHGPRQNREGTLTDGNTVVIKNKMVFNVTPTDKS